MAKPKKFKTVTKNKYTSDDLQAIDSYQPREKKFGREVLSISVSKELKTWLEDTVKYLNHQSKRRITKSEVASLALSQLKEKPYTTILKEIRML